MKKFHFNYKSALLFNLLCVLSLIFTLPACDAEEEKKEEDNFKSPSKGGFMEILVITDKTKWNGRVGEALREVLTESIPGLPQDEPRFKVVNIAPQDFGRFLKKHHNILMVTALMDSTSEGRLMKGFFTRETLQMLQKDESKFMLAKADEFARGQRSLFLFAKDDFQLVKNIEKSRDQIIEYFQKAERERLLSKLLGGGDIEQKKLQNKIEEETGLHISVPPGFLVAKKDSNFLWLRALGKPIDRSILITYGNYSSEEMFTNENIVKWRNHFGYTKMNDTTAVLKNSYMDTQEDEFPTESKKLLINGLYVVEYRGLWRLKNKTQGGPFIGYAFVDEAKKKFYYIEGFVYAPGQNKRKPITEMEAILRTFQVKSKKAKKS